MTGPELLARLRAATTDDVARALDRSYVVPPLASDAELLEFFNRMLDAITGEDDRAEREERERAARATNDEA